MLLGQKSCLKCHAVRIPQQSSAGRSFFFNNCFLSFRLEERANTFGWRRSLPKLASLTARLENHHCNLSFFMRIYSSRVYFHAGAYGRVPLSI